jgi:acyl-CoA thioesterase-1
LSSTVSCGIRLKAWKTNPIFSPRNLLSASSSISRASCPSRMYCPSVGLSRQPSVFMSVDLPEPDAPMIATYSPSRIVRSMPLSASTITEPSGL